jgi:predicted ATP-grasp superfamily ATP-dependent carboligase
MRLFICEFITGGGMQQKSLPGNLVHEGEMMLQALMHDVTDAGITDIVTTRDYRLEHVEGECMVLDKHDNVWNIWGSIMQTVDAVWPIAPETDGDLLRLSELAIQCGCKLFGCMPEGVANAGSKLKTYQLLSHHHIPSIETYTVDGYVPDFDDGWILKPDDGVGGGDCRLFYDRRALEEAITVLQNQDNYVVQPYIKGNPASLSMLCYKQTGELMASNRQQFVFSDTQGHLEMITVNGLADQWSTVEPVARKIAAAIPGLAGYVGVDLILTRNGPIIVEINPRLTTAYVGLRKSIGVNPVAMIINLFETRQLPPVKLEKKIPVTINLQ